ncbi:MAG: putative glycoside hydrolase [Patescibacteria group bacterium]|nr:putative glycoside hydrolase [Patescibacteria group bacterium]
MTIGYRQHTVIVIIAAVALATLLAMPVEAKLNAPADKFVRTANFYYRAGTDITPGLFPQLAKYDVLVLPSEAQIFNPSLARELKKLNPNITLLAYVPTKSWNDTYWTDALHAKLKAGIQDDWWLVDSSGNRVSVWPGTTMINTVSGWQNWLPQYVKDHVMSSGFWDGIMYDEFSGNVSWVNGGNIDLHRTGQRTDPALADVAWQRATTNMLKRTRDLLGPDAVIITNGDSTDVFQPYVNGRVFESFPTPWEAGGTWGGVMANYLRLQSRVAKPSVFIVNANTGGSGNQADYRKVRYSLGSTLLGDGFFSFDLGEGDHGQLWWYDEFNANLGRPLGAPSELLSPARKNVAAGLWRRDFENGMVLVNSTGETHAVRLDGELEKIRGTQAPQINDGAVVTSVNVPPNDGLILLKPLNNLQGTGFPNGAFARVYDAKGAQQRNGFFSYVRPFPGNAVVIIKDIDGDGRTEKTVGAGGQLTVYDADGNRKWSARPFGDKWSGAVNVAAADTNGDGKTEIIAAAGADTTPQVRVYSPTGEALGPSFLAFAANFKGGVNVAAGDLYGTGRAAIIVGAGPGGGPHVRVFSQGGRLLNTGFFAYDSRFRGGVSVAVGDVNGDGKTEIITGAGPGGGPHVRLFNRFGTSLGRGFFVGSQTNRGGVKVAVADANGDGRPDIIAMTADVFQISASAR